MKNLFKICVLCALFGVAVKAQENNGVFVGFEVGAGEQKLSQSMANTTSTAQGTAVLFGIKVGYKHFLLDWVGISGYFGVDYAETQSGRGDANKISVFRNFSYTANVDALLNFYNAENVAVGVFVGLGIGGQSARAENFLFDDKVRTITDLYSDVKVGLRVNAANHGMEFAVKIPLKDATKTIKNAGTNINVKHRQPYQIMLGYNFTFVAR